MTTTTIPRSPRAARPAPAPVGLRAALAEIPRDHKRWFVAGFVVDLLLAFALLSIVWGL